MTLGDGKRRVLMLLDEYSAGGEITTDYDINNKMNDFFDMAQKDMAAHKPIIKKEEIDLDGEQYVDLPERFDKYYRVWKDGEPYKKLPIIGGQIYAGGSTDTILVEYFAIPETITEDTADTYEFELAEDACNCLPFYVAAQQLITDLVIDYSALWNMYLSHKANVKTSVESGQGKVRQALFRR